jgi:hypothetical protein
MIQLLVMESFEDFVKNQHENRHARLFVHEFMQERNQKTNADSVSALQKSQVLNLFFKKTYLLLQR